MKPTKGKGDFTISFKGGDSFEKFADMQQYRDKLGDFTLSGKRFCLSVDIKSWEMVPKDDANTPLSVLKEYLEDSQYAAKARILSVNPADGVCKLQIKCFRLKCFPTFFNIAVKGGVPGLLERCREVIAPGPPGYLDFFVLSPACLEARRNELLRKYPGMVAVALAAQLPESCCCLVISAVPQGNRELVVIEGIEPAGSPLPALADLTLYRVHAALTEESGANPVSANPFRPHDGAAKGTQGKYLSMWSDYCLAEENYILGQIAEIGCRRLSPAQVTIADDGSCLVTPSPDCPREWLELLQGQTVQLTSGEPPHLALLKGASSPGERLDRLRKFMLEEKDGAKPPVDLGIKFSDEEAEMMHGSGSLLLKIPWEQDIAEDYPYLSLSTSGLAQPLKRRRDALAALEKGTGPGIPHLPALLDEDDSLETISCTPPTDIRMDEGVSAEVFSNGPNPSQEAAVNMALSTPDICLVQGPPGTGKTTVIKAIIKCLCKSAKMNLRDKPLFIGVFAQQHVAVTNVTDHVSVFGIPAIKCGVSSQERRGDLSASQDPRTARLQELLGQLRERLAEKHPDLRDLYRRTSLGQAYSLYLASPTRQNACTVLNTIAAPESGFSPELKVEARHKLAELRSAKSAPGDAALLAAIRSIRVTKAGFRDDGPARAGALLVLLGGHPGVQKGCPGALEVLKRASEARDVTGQLLHDLAETRRKLLLYCLPEQEYRERKCSDDIVRLVGKVQEQAMNQSPEAWRRGILADFISMAASNHLSLLRGWEEYTWVLGSTVQQCAGHTLNKLLGKRAGNDNISVSFDTVIIDEAARCSPPDLLIPMVRAARRIVLVGDHRQLPHIVDEKFVQGYEQGMDIEEIKREPGVAPLYKSMFEYLMDRLALQEARDGVKRCIMLDVQYRMHPDLGAFVNRNFYEPHGANLNSGLPANHPGYRHKLSFNGKTGQTMAWIDVPVNRGYMLRNGTSWARPCEADAIATHLMRWMQEEPELSFQVITYYAAQAQLITQKIKAACNGCLPDRLEVGTVDAFQGKEADIVLLSVVRTQREFPPKRRTQGAIFGHLAHENRLCVSMSRQRRALVLVGDAEFFRRTPENDAVCVRALADFYDECSRRGTLIPPSLQQ